MLTDDYPGLTDLRKHIVDQSRPSFSNFIAQNQDQIAKWSVNLSCDGGPALHGLWFERYKKQYSTLKPSSVKRRCPKYNAVLWDEIMSRVSTLRQLKSRYKRKAIEVLMSAADEAARDVMALFEDDMGAGISSRAQDHGYDEETEEADNDYLADKRLLPSLGMKRLQDTLRPSDRHLLGRITCNGGDIESRINKHVVKLILQTHLTGTEEETLKLLLSKAINFLDDNIYATMSDVFSPSQMRYLMGKEENWIGMDLVTDALVNRLLNNGNNTYNILIAIHTEMVEFLKNKDTESDSYNILCVLQTVIQSFNVKICPDASETTCYRRFAILLDYIFTGMQIEMRDGEAIANATRMAVEQNQYDLSKTFGRKIDLLVNIEGTAIALNSNEWKAHKTSHMKLKQQSKNIRSNCTILNNLYTLSHGRINSIMAIDVIGTIGYLYLLRYDQGVYVATKVRALFLPSSVDQLRRFKDTIEALMIWRNFMEDQVKTIQHACLSDSLASIARERNTDDEISLTTPPVFFTPTRKRAGKRPIGEVA